MGVENKCLSLDCPAACCHNPTICMRWSKFERFTGNLGDAVEIHQVPREEFSLIRGDDTLEEGIYYTTYYRRFSLGEARVVVFIPGPCPELKDQECGVWDTPIRPRACTELPIGGKVCLHKRKKIAF